jgi:hypothetical protein
MQVFRQDHHCVDAKWSFLPYGADRGLEVTDPPSTGLRESRSFSVTLKK